jgi:hypothetical protein
MMDGCVVGMRKKRSQREACFFFSGQQSRFFCAGYRSFLFWPGGTVRSGSKNEKKKQGTHTHIHDENMPANEQVPSLQRLAHQAFVRQASQLPESLLLPLLQACRQRARADALSVLRQETEQAAEDVCFLMAQAGVPQHVQEAVNERIFRLLR